MCAAGLQSSSSYWSPVEKLILHLSPVTRRKTLRNNQGSLKGSNNNNNNNTINEKKSRRGRRTHSEPSAGHGSNRTSVESIPSEGTSYQQSAKDNQTCNSNDNHSLPPLAYGHHKISNHQKESVNNHWHRSNGHHHGGGTTNGFHSINLLPTSSPRSHRNLLMKRGCGNSGSSHASKPSINSCSSTSLSSPTSGSASSSENDDQSLFFNEIQTMKCHSLFKVCKLSNMVIEKLKTKTKSPNLHLHKTYKIFCIKETTLILHE